MNPLDLPCSLPLRKESLQEKDLMFFQGNPMIHIRTYEDFQRTYDIFNEELDSYLNSLKSIQDTQELTLFELSNLTYKLFLQFFENISNYYKILNFEIENQIISESKGSIKLEKQHIRMIQVCLLLEFIIKFIHKAKCLLTIKEKKEKKKIFKIKEIV